MLSVILPFSFFPFGVYLAYLYYASALPPGLLDAARVDGCSELQTFLRIALPLAKPVVALVFFFSFVADWNNFFLPYVVLANSNQYPITVGLWTCSRRRRRSIRGWRRRPVAQDLQAGTRARNVDRRRSGGDRLRLLAASARSGSRRRSSEGVKHGQRHIREGLKAIC